MIHHTSVAVSNYAKGKAFYETILAPLGYTIGKDVPDFKAAGFKDGNGDQDFWLGESDKEGTVHVAFVAKSKEAVEAFHAAGLNAGGTDNGAPGYRDMYHPGYYAAFIHDPDGNNIEAVWMDPTKL
jgi:catechol 2,3-dioxygenase-like lactoylglutathione lyase family enzyme